MTRQRPGVFARFQPIYAAHRVPTFPVVITSDGAKRPAITGYPSVGLNGSRKLAEKFPEHETFGCNSGKRSSVTVLDSDSRDESVLADAMTRHGHTPLVVKSGSG